MLSRVSPSTCLNVAMRPHGPDIRTPTCVRHNSHRTERRRNRPQKICIYSQTQRHSIPVHGLTDSLPSLDRETTYLRALARYCRVCFETSTRTTRCDHPFLSPLPPCCWLLRPAHEANAIYVWLMLSISIFPFLLFKFGTVRLLPCHVQVSNLR